MSGEYTTAKIVCCKCGDFLGTVSGYEEGVKSAVEHHKNDVCSNCQTGTKKDDISKDGWKF